MFKRSIRGKVTLNLNFDERKVLRELFSQMHELLELPDVPEESDPLAALVGLDGPTQEPSDPAIARLFPSAYKEDEDAASDFEMVSHLLETDSEKLELNSAQINAWLRSLNDLRLVLGTRIGITDDYREKQSTDPGLHLYDYLTYLQSTLIEAL
jgi:hypothetical protein